MSEKSDSIYPIDDPSKLLISFGEATRRFEHPPLCINPNFH